MVENDVDEQLELGRLLGEVDHHFLEAAEVAEAEVHEAVREAGVDLRLVPFDGKQVTKPNVERYIEGQKSLKRQA